MKLFVIIATVVAYTCAAPAVDLQHLSPVNPDILVGMKPEEKILLITHPKEINLKRETKRKDNEDGTTKHDYNLHNLGNVTESNTKTVESLKGTKKPLNQSHDLNQSSLHTRNRRNVESCRYPKQCKHTEVKDLQNPQTLPTILPSKEILQKIESKKINNDKNEMHQEKVAEHVSPEVKQKPQRLSAIFSSSHQLSVTPASVAKLTLQESSYKKNIKKESHNEGEGNNSGIKSLPGHKQHHISTEGFQKIPAVPSILKETNSDKQQQKRDIPVPLVPKHHHSEESEETNEEKPSESNKEVNSKNNQTLEHDQKNHNNEHVTTVATHKPQMLSIHQDHLSQNANQHHHDAQNHYTSQTLAEHNPASNQEHSVPTKNSKEVEALPNTSNKPSDTKLQQNHEVARENSSENKEKIKKHNDVPVEDLRDSTVSMNPSHHIQENPKSIIQSDHLNDLTTSTSEHPLIRQRPVPVAQLFTRAHGNSKMNDEEA